MEVSMGVAVIRNDDDLTAALRAIDALWQAEPGSAESDRLTALVDEVVAYEDAIYSIHE
jgi:antitoxin component HigA of HigAB toxin-antitoxin module